PNLPGYTLVAFAAHPNRPLDRCSLPDGVAPIFTDLGEIVGENEGSSAAVGAVDHDDRLVRKIDAGIGLRNGRVVPLLNLSEKNTCQSFGSELDFSADPRDVVGGHDRTQHSGDMQDLGLGLRQLFVGHGAIAGSEIDGAVQNLANAAAAADRLVVDLNI